MESKKADAKDGRLTMKNYKTNLKESLGTAKKFLSLIVPRSSTMTNKLTLEKALKGRRVITRIYKGRTLKLAVGINGFVLNGKVYPSLSKASIAATKNSSMTDGPRFWGVIAR